jgi:hypothetical protein
MIQKVRRLTGRAFFHLTQESKKPTHVGLIDTGFTPLWEMTENGQPPPAATRRATLGQTWTISHDQLSTAIVLVVDHDATAWLVSPTRDRYPATADGWRRMLETVTGPR